MTFKEELEALDGPEETDLRTKRAQDMASVITGVALSSCGGDGPTAVISMGYAMVAIWINLGLPMETLESGLKACITDCLDALEVGYPN